MSFKSIEKMLNFYGQWNEIESLLYECNRLRLVMTITDHERNYISFDQTVQVQENLLAFGQKLRQVFQNVQEKRAEGGERARIFGKVKEKLDDETRSKHELR